MILDGYNRRASLTVGGSTVKLIYRPLLSAHANDRKRWRWEISWLGDEAAQREIDQFYFRQIVAWDLSGFESGGMRFLRERHASAHSELLRILHGVSVDASGERWRDVEEQWATNLREGVILDLSAPKIARRSCADCVKFWYLSNGEVKIQNSTGEKELRPEFALPSCRTEFGCPKGTPENPRTLNAANGWAWRHFRLCDASGIFPDDAIVKSNCKIIQSAKQEAERVKKVGGKADR